MDLKDIEMIDASGAGDTLGMNPASDFYTWMTGRRKKIMV